MQINANLVTDDDLGSDAGSEFDSPTAAERGGSSKRLRRERSTTTQRKATSENKQLNKDILNRGTPINVDFRAFILPPAP